MVLLGGVGLIFLFFRYGCFMYKGSMLYPSQQKNGGKSALTVPILYLKEKGVASEWIQPLEFTGADGRI